MSHLITKFLPGKTFYFWFPNSTSGNIGLLCISILCTAAYIIPECVELYPYNMSDNLLIPPVLDMNQAYFMGTDDLGRDLFSRLIYGARTSICVGSIIVILSAIIGTFMGLVAAVYGGWTEKVIIRITDIIMSLPGILLAIVIVAIFGTGLINAIIAITLVSIPRYVRIVRSVAALEMRKQYVLASMSFGTPRYKILYSEVLPNCVAPIIVQATLGLSDAILDIAALGFLGLGAKPPVAEWGAMLADSRIYIESYPYLVVMPGMCILITILALNLVGDALRDFFDPKMKDKA